MSGALLCMHQVSSGYQKDVVVKDMTLDIEKGELIGIIGPNGSGKTTLLRLMTRILKPWSGSISISGADIWHSSQRDIARKIAVVSQNVAPVSMTVAQYVELGRIPHYSAFQIADSGEGRKTALKYMEMTDTLALRHSMIDEISGGERQLAQIARALTQQPEILFLDEPTSHLDIRHQVRILDLIKRLNTDLQISVIMVIHDLNLASEYCSRLVLLEDGHIRKDGTPDEVLTYEMIEDVYHTTVIVEKNPLSQKPFILLVTENELLAHKAMSK